MTKMYITFLFSQILLWFSHFNPLSLYDIFCVSFQNTNSIKNFVHSLHKVSTTPSLWALKKHFVWNSRLSNIPGFVCMHVSYSSIVLLASWKCIALKYFLIYRSLHIAHYDGCLNPCKMYGLTNVSQRW